MEDMIQKMACGCDEEHYLRENLICEDCNAFDQIEEEVLPGKYMAMSDICTLILNEDNSDIDRDGPNELARNCPLRQAI